MNYMEFHPSQIPIAKIFHLKDERDASEAAQEMVKIGFFSDDKGFKVLMPKNDTKIGNSVPSQVRKGLSLSTPHFMYPVRIVEITIRIKSVIPILRVLRIISNTILNGSITKTLPDSVISQIPISTPAFPEES